MATLLFITFFIACVSLAVSVYAAIEVHLHPVTVTKFAPRVLTPSPAVISPLASPSATMVTPTKKPKLITQEEQNATPTAKP